MLKEKKNKKVLVFTAHPDDHLCGAGTLMMLKERGFEIEEIVATRGEIGPWWISKNKRKKEFKKRELAKIREEEIGKASKIIGISKTIFLDLPDSKIVRDLRTIEKMVGIIRRKKPEIVFAMNENDYHCDHREFSKMTLEALKKASWNYLPEKGEPWRVPIVLLMEGFYFIEADLIVDITPYLEKKQKIISIYQSQIDFREKKLLESIGFWRAFFLRERNSQSAEAFEIPKNFPIDFKRLITIFGS